MADPVTGTYLGALVRWTLAVRLGLLVVLLVMPVDQLQRPGTLLAVVLVAAWSLLWVLPRSPVLQAVTRHPLLAVADVLLTTAIIGLVGVTSLLVLVTLTTALLIGILVPPVAAWLVTTVLVLSFLLVEHARTGDFGGEEASYLLVPSTYVVLAVLGSVTRRLHEQMVADQAEKLRLREDAAAARERARLAREMHDSVAKSLHGLALAAASLRSRIQHDADGAERLAGDIQVAAHGAAQEARVLLDQLRTDPEEAPLVDRLQALVEEYDAHPGSTRVRLEAHHVAHLEHRQAHEVVQVVAEALENAHRHAGADEVVVRVDGRRPAAVEVVDDGRGFDPDRPTRGRYGLVGLRERAADLGADLELASRPGEGTTVRLVLPDRSAGRDRAATVATGGAGHG